MTHAPHCVRYYWEGEWWHSAWCNDHVRSYTLTVARSFEKRYPRKDVTWQWALIYAETMREMLEYEEAPSS